MPNPIGCVDIIDENAGWPIPFALNPDGAHLHARGTGTSEAETGDADVIVREHKCRLRRQRVSSQLGSLVGVLSVATNGDARRNVTRGRSRQAEWLAIVDLDHGAPPQRQRPVELCLGCHDDEPRVGLPFVPSAATNREYSASDTSRVPTTSGVRAAV